MYVIRADGNARIGMGHLMRCLTIADAIEEKEQVLFICADQKSAKFAAQNGYQARALGTDHGDMESELPVWREIFQEERLKRERGEKGLVLLVDSYAVTDRYLESLRAYGRVVLLDDMARRAYPADAVVNYNAFAHIERYRELYQGRDTRCYVGSQYVPLRPQFLGIRREVGNFVTDVLITAGGGDADNLAWKILQTIEDEKLRYHIISGRFHPYFAQWKDWALTHPNVSVYHDVKNMAALMLRCDLAITAGGTTIYELAYLGIPFVCFSCADNQEALTEYIGREGIAAYAGAFHKDKGGAFDRLEWCYRSLLGDMEMRKRYYCKEKEMIDGMGAHRLSKILREEMERL